jgi:hypothetical protein
MTQRSEQRLDRVLVLGATSAIAQACIRVFAAEGARLYLVGRDAHKLESVCADARVRGAAAVEARALDLNHFDCHPDLISRAIAQWGGLDAALIAHGVLPDQKKCETDPAALLHAFDTNCSSVLSLAVLLADHFEREKRGVLAVIASVAGDRGRASNYAYGAAKAGVACFLQGLRARLAAAGATVLTIKPGFVDTPMTADLPKNPLYASAERVGQRIHQAMTAREQIVYVPWFWRWIMLAIRIIPERLFVKVKM